MDANLFVNPPAANRLLPLWVWNGSVEDGEIVRQIREMAEKGVGGICIVPGTGLRVPCLSRAWFDRVALAAATAAGHGLEVWINGEYPHPNGTMSERVTLGRPDLRAQHIEFQEITVQGGQQVDMVLPRDPVLRAIAVPLKRDRSLWEDTEDIGGFVGYNRCSSSGGRADTEAGGDASGHRLFWKAPAGRWRVMVFLQTADRACSSGERFDPLNPAAVGRYVSSCLDPCADRLQDSLGKSVPGLLSTEPAASEPVLPWSELLPAAFAERNGYDLVKCLPALVTHFGTNTARIRYDYFQTLSEMLETNYYRVLSEWSDGRGLTYAADTPVLRHSRRRDVGIPGSSVERRRVGAEETAVDAWASYRTNPGFAASAANQDGKSRVINSCFHSADWSLTMSGMKATLDDAAAAGCNTFALHGLHFALGENRGPLSSPSLFHQNPYWKHFRLLSDYSGRLSYALGRGQRAVNLALLDPVTSLWTHLAHPDLGWRYIGTDPDEEKLANRLVEDWGYISESLVRVQRDHDHLDPERLADASISGGRLRVGNASYDVLVTPPITSLEYAAFDKLREFLNKGGKVVCMGLLPVEDIQEGQSVVESLSRMTDMDPGRMIKDYVGHEFGVHVLQRGSLHLVRTGGSVARNGGARALEKLLDEILPKAVTVEAESEATSAVRVHQRLDGRDRILFLANTSSDTFEAQVSVRVPQRHRKVERWDLETGRRSVLDAEFDGGHARVALPFGPNQSHLLVVSEGRGKAETCETLIDLSVDTRGHWKVELEEDNVLRLDRFRMQIDPQSRGTKQGWHKTDYKDSRWPVVSPGSFLEQLRVLSPPPDLPFEVPDDGTDTAGIQLPIVCWFRATFSADVVPGKLALVMDRGAIQGEHQVYLNGSRIPGNAFRPTFRYDQGNLTCAVGRRVTKGRNVVAVRVEVSSFAEGVRDALYLFGRMGVASWRSDYLRITPPRERGPVGNPQALRMPYYAGTTAYTRDVSLKKPREKRFRLLLSEAAPGRNDIVEILVNGHSMGVRAWAPYQWVGQSSWLKSGKNRVTLRVTNTLSRLLTGHDYDAKAGAMALVSI